MCKAFEDHYKSGVEEGRQQGKQLGIEEGRQQGISQGVNIGIRALIETCREFRISRSATLEKITSKFQIPKDSAENYMTKYC